MRARPKAARWHYYIALRPFTSDRVVTIRHRRCRISRVTSRESRPPASAGSGHGFRKALSKSWAQVGWDEDAHVDCPPAAGFVVAGGCGESSYPVEVRVARGYVANSGCRGVGFCTELVDSRVEISDRYAMGLRDQLADAGPYRRAEAGAPDAAYYSRYVVTVAAAVEEAGRRRTRGERDVGNVALFIFFDQPLLKRGRIENLA